MGGWGKKNGSLCFPHQLFSTQPLSHLCALGPVGLPMHNSSCKHASEREWEKKHGSVGVGVSHNTSP